jgi:hypothetical protein
MKDQTPPYDPAVLDDPYAQLRPPAPTPIDEICSCPSGTPIMLMTALGENPIHCLDCNLEVDPKTLPLPLGMVGEVAHWRWIASAFEALELDSGAYEDLAQRELGDLGSAVNVEGLELRQRLDGIRRCYFVLFQKMREDLEWVVPTVCPLCGGGFVEYSAGRFTRLMCEVDSLVLLNSRLC